MAASIKARAASNALRPTSSSRYSTITTNRLVSAVAIVREKAGGEPAWARRAATTRSIAWASVSDPQAASVLWPAGPAAPWCSPGSHSRKRASNPGISRTGNFISPMSTTASSAVHFVQRLGPRRARILRKSMSGSSMAVNSLEAAALGGRFGLDQGANDVEGGLDVFVFSLNHNQFAGAGQRKGRFHRLPVLGDLQDFGAALACGQSLAEEPGQFARPAVGRRKVFVQHDPVEGPSQLFPLANDVDVPSSVARRIHDRALLVRKC